MQIPKKKRTSLEQCANDALNEFLKHINKNIDMLRI